MENIGQDLQSEKIMSRTAIRCAKAAILLSSVQNATKNFTADVPKLQDEEIIEKLMIELVKEREKQRKLRHCIRITLVFHFIVLLIYPIFLNSLTFCIL